MKLTRLRVLLMLVLAVSLTGISVWHFASAGSASTRNSSCVPGSCGTQPCDIRIYIDGSQYGAANCRTGDNYGFNTVPDFGATINTLATPNCPANGCLIYIEPGSYSITTVINTLVTGDTLEGGSREGVIISAPSPALVAGKDWIINKDQSVASGGDKGIVLRDFTFKGGTPTISGAAYVNYDNAIHFQGAFQSLLFNLHLLNAAPRFDFGTGATAAQKEGQGALNWGNTMELVIADGFVGSAAFFSCNDCIVKDSQFLNNGDDAFIVVGWGRNDLFDSDYFDNSNNANPTVGSSNGQLYLDNDGSVVANTNNTAIDAGIWHCHFVKNQVNSGQRTGLAVNIGATARVYGSIFELEPGLSGGLNTQSGGIVSLGVLRLQNSISRFNQANGVVIVPAPTGKTEDNLIEGSKLYDNGKSGGGGNTAGIEYRPCGASISQFTTILDTAFFDDQGSPTQTTGLDQPCGPGANTRTLYVANSNFNNQPTTTINHATNAVWINTVNNAGWNPQSTRSVTAGASVYTYTNLDIYSEQLVLTTLGGITAYTCLGANQAQTLGIPSPILAPGQACVFTWATTAPVFQVDPL